MRFGTVNAMTRISAYVRALIREYRLTSNEVNETMPRHSVRPSTVFNERVVPWLRDPQKNTAPGRSQRAVFGSSFGTARRCQQRQIFQTTSALSAVLSYPIGPKNPHSKLIERNWPHGL